jgi:hypothetical protein
MSAGERAVAKSQRRHTSLKPIAAAITAQGEAQKHTRHFDVPEFFTPGCHIGAE